MYIYIMYIFVLAYILLQMYVCNYVSMYVYAYIRFVSRYSCIQILPMWL